MVIGKRSLRNRLEEKREGSEIVAVKNKNNVEIVELESDVEEEDWCFVCKDGGKLRLCDHPKCHKSYHHGCVGQKISFLKSSEDWQCAQHSCLRCKGIPIVACYSCPNAVCKECLHAADFVRLGDENGFCEKCMKFVLYIEGETKRKPSLEVSSTTYEHFVEYYGIIKKKYGFTLDDHRAAQKVGKSREKRKSLSLDEEDENERLGGFQKMKLDCSKTSQKEKVMSNMIRVAALVSDNVRLIYLTRSVIEKLLMQPESFEDKVTRTFVGIELPRKGGSNKIARQLVQVTGITKTSCHDGQISIKLQAKNMPNDISIDGVSDLDYSEILCRDLSQQVKDGLIEMPAIEELERMATVLSEVIVDDWIARERRRLQGKLDMANEKGWRQELQTSAERWRLIRTFPKVITEIVFPDSMSEEIANETQEVSPESIPNTVSLCENDKIASGPTRISIDMMDDENQNEGAPKSIAYNLELNKEKSSVIKYCKRSPPVQEKVRKLVNEPEITEPVPLTTKTIVKSQPEKLWNFNSTHLHLDSFVAQQLDLQFLSGKQEGTKFCDIIGNLVKVAGKPDDQVRETDEELVNVADNSYAEMFGVESECNVLQPVLEEQKSFDVMHEEFENNANESSRKILVVVKDKIDTPEVKMDDELLQLKSMTQEDICLSAAKLASMEGKMDRIEQQIKQMVDKAQSAEEEEALQLSYKRKSEMFMDALFKLMEPVSSLVCTTKTLEEIREKFLPDLDLRRYPTYDPNAIERVPPLLKGAVQSFMDAGFAEQKTTEEDISSELLLPLASQPPDK